VPNITLTIPPSLASSLVVLPQVPECNRDLWLCGVTDHALIDAQSPQTNRQDHPSGSMSFTGVIGGSDAVSPGGVGGGGGGGGRTSPRGSSARGGANSSSGSNPSGSSSAVNITVRSSEFFGAATDPRLPGHGSKITLIVRAR
jgi:hypothetical protein